MHLRVSRALGRGISLERKPKWLEASCPKGDHNLRIDFGDRVFSCETCRVGGDALALAAWMRGEPIRQIYLTLKLSRDRKELDLVKKAQLFFVSELEPERKSSLYGRGLKDETITKFGLGYAGENQLSRSGLSWEQLEQVGLAKCRYGGWGQVLTNRITLPMKREDGEPLGFGGRALDDHAAKFLSSAETPWYRKGIVLFGLAESWREIRRSGWAIVVEGFYDVMMMHQVGFTNTVAPCGTRWSVEQSRLLARYARNVVLMLDGDNAGVKATGIVAEQIKAVGMKCVIATLDKERDPDDVLREDGPEAIASFIRRAKPCT